MLRRSSWFIVLIASSCHRAGSPARPVVPPDPAKMVVKPQLDGPWMQAFVERFATDAMAGRYTLDAAAIGKAADALGSEYASLGVAKVGGDYRVPFEFEHGTQVERAHHLWVEASGPARALPADQTTTLSPAAEVTAVATLVFAGPRALAKPPAAMRDRIVMMQDPIVPPAAPTPDNADLRVLANRLAAAGARALLVVGERAVGETGTPWPIPVVALRSAAAESIATAGGTALAELAGKSGLTPLTGVRLSLAPRRAEQLEHANNVLAWIPGTESPGELVLIGAHYDHIGTTAHGLMCREQDGDTTCNGADDNASGTAMVLAIAKALVSADYRPKRTLVFVHFAGEELGLHGSKALANHLPAAKPFAGAKIVAMLNFDMVGRLGAEGLWVGGVGSSSAWMPLLARIGSRGIPTVYERSVTSRSDHASFYAKDIPVLFFFTGLHADYHKPGDEVAAMNFAGMTTIGEIALDLTVALASGEAVVFAPPGEDDGLVTRMPGSDARTVEKQVGVGAPKAP